jgi:hypothetical protein
MSDAPYPGRLCPHCGEAADGQTSVDRENVSIGKPGDYCICLSCIGVSIFTESGGLEPVAPEKVDHLIVHDEDFTAAYDKVLRIWTLWQRRQYDVATRGESSR